MSLSDIAYEFTVQLMQTSITEAIAVVFGVISVVLANRNHVLLYPTGIISTALYTYVMSKGGLYAESWLNGYYLIMSIYGWLRWNKNNENQSDIAITHNNKQDWLITGAIVSLGFVTLYSILIIFTKSTVPMWDALVASFAWAGMWLLAKHKIENWVLLNISNAIAVPLLIYKGLQLTALLTVILFTVAVFGYFRWRKLYRQQHG